MKFEKIITQGAYERVQTEEKRLGEPKDMIWYPASKTFWIANSEGSQFPWHEDNQTDS